MADAAVEFLLDNLKQLLLHHAHLIKDAKIQLEKLERDLRFLKAFLRDSTKSRRKDETLKALIQEIRDVVYEAEDIIDTYVTQAAAAEAKSWSFIPKLRNRAELTEHVEAVCKKIRDIYNEKNWFDFGFLSIEDGGPSPIIEVTFSPFFYIYNLGCWFKLSS